MNKPIEISEEDGKVLFGGDTEQVAEIVDEVVKAEVTDENTDTKKEEEGEVVEEVIETIETTEDFVTTVVSNKEEIQEAKDITEEKQPEAKLTVKPKATIKFKDEYHAALNKYISETEEYDIDAFNRMYKGLPSGISDMEVIRAKFYNDPSNEGISQKALSRMFQLELAKYDGLDSDDPEEKELAEGLLKRDANNYLKQFNSERKSFVEKYKSDLEQEIEVEGDFEQPGVVEGKSPEVLRAEREAMQKHYQDLIKPIIGDGFLTLKDKEGEIKIPVSNPEKIIEAAIDPMGFIRSLIVGEDGSVNIERFVEVVAFATDKNQYNSSLISYSKGLGTKGVVETIKNTTPIGQPKQTGLIDENSPDFLEKMFKGAQIRQK
jgi:hypothetical protein